MFYYFKNETLDEIDDDDLILLMETCFNGVCQGSADLLRDSVLEVISRAVRYGDLTAFDRHDAYNPESGDE
jgi:hypothetical protein